MGIGGQSQHRYNPPTFRRAILHRLICLLLRLHQFFLPTFTNAALLDRNHHRRFCFTLMFAAGLIAWRKLAGDAIGYTPARTWRWFFAGISIAALIGFVVHGLSFYTPPNVHLAVWLTMGLVQSAGVSAAQLATVQQFLPRRQRLLQGFVIGQLVLTTIVLISFQSYAVVKYHLALGLVPIMIWQFILALRAQKSSRWIAGGILVSAFTSAVHGLKLSLSLWFNYNDISHLLIIVSIWLIGKGALLINDENNSSRTTLDELN
jgi:hypothetical protein